MFSLNHPFLSEAFNAIIPKRTMPKWHGFMPNDMRCTFIFITYAKLAQYLPNVNFRKSEVF